MHRALCSQRLQTSKIFKVPVAILRRQRLKKNEIAVEFKKHLGATLNEEVEKTLVNLILDLESVFSACKPHKSESLHTKLQKK